MSQQFEGFKFMYPDGTLHEGGPPRRIRLKVTFAVTLMYQTRRSATTRSELHQNWQSKIIVKHRSEAKINK
jgi:hypothetical protein